MKTWMIVIAILVLLIIIISAIHSAKKRQEAEELARRNAQQNQGNGFDQFMGEVIVPIAGTLIDSALYPEKYKQCCGNCIYFRNGVCGVCGAYVNKAGICGYWRNF